MQEGNSDYSIPMFSGPLSLRSDADKCFQFVRECLQSCLISHEKCKSYAAAPLPKRIISLNGDKIKLMETGDLHGRYVALSHCWGKSQPFKTTEANIEQMKADIAWESLSIVFQNAVTVCRRMEIDFLWIDSLCIIQDSDQDWEIESSKMCEYYEHAHFTISAACSPNGNVPFLTRRDEKWLPHEFHLIDRRGNDRVFRARQCAGSSISQPIEDAGTLATRAWVWQEAILSTRLLSFTSSELIWECKETALAEDGGVPRGLFSMRLPQQLDRYQTTPMLGWHELVGTYSIRDLTFPTDRLPALGGVASKMSEILESDYLAGLWKKNLIADLCWSVDYTAEEILRYRPVDYLAPSWAWPSVSGPIVFQDYDAHEDVVSLATIMDVQCTVPGLNPYGKVSNGYLVLRGRLAYLTVACHTPQDCWAYTIFKDEGEDSEPMTVDCQLIHNSGVIRRAHHGEAIKLEKFNAEVPCVPMQKMVQDDSVDLFVLVLQKVEGGVYVRVGCAVLDDDEWFQGVREVTIRVI